MEHFFYSAAIISGMVMVWFGKHKDVLWGRGGRGGGSGDSWCVQLTLTGSSIALILNFRRNIAEVVLVLDAPLIVADAGPVG